MVSRFVSARYETVLLGRKAKKETPVPVNPALLSRYVYFRHNAVSL